MSTTTFTPEYLLKKYFGYDAFRPMQFEVIQAVLNQKDSLVLMPTGGGKSVCYQIPAMMLSGLTLVISPLISLMKDQVDTLNANGIPAAYLNSSLSMDEEGAILRNCSVGNVKLLYIAPERLISGFEYLMASMNIQLVAIDEAHCISSWGHDFRPEYTQMSIIKEKFPHIPLIALTATADKLTRKDIVSQLNLQNPEIFVASFNRPNLSLTVRTGMREKEKIREIIDFIRLRPEESGIIYCLSRKTTEAVAEDLNRFGVPAKFYHAGMNGELRAQAQEDFMNDKTQVICATVAFGMGIDKSNVRWVIHYNLPKSLESYYQEIGRAGRDGLPSDTILYYNLGDLQLLTKFAVESGQADLNIEKLQRMQQYAEADICRRKILLNYFGENSTENCGNCDVCQNPPKHFDGTKMIQQALSGLIRMNEKVGTQMLIDVLRGSQRQEVLEAGYDKIKTYGVGSAISASDWKQYLMQMLNLGIIEMAYDEHFSLKVTDLGKEIVYGKRSMDLVQLQKRNFGVGERKTSAPASPKPVSKEEQLFDLLRKERRRLAEVQEVPPYVIFTDATLNEMVQVLPTTEEDFLTISGVSQRKLDSYGTEMLAVIRNFLQNNLLSPTLSKGKREVQTPKPSTYEATLVLYQQGLPIEQIAEQRNLALTTVYSHIAALYIEDKIKDISHLLEKENIDLVRQARIQTGEKEKMKPLYEFLEEKVPYFQIRLALAWLEKQGE